jgi:hypothetical protein
MSNHARVDAIADVASQKGSRIRVHILRQWWVKWLTLSSWRTPLLIVSVAADVLIPEMTLCGTSVIAVGKVFFH